MHVVSVVGARPQFIKLAPIAEALHSAGFRHTIIHTGQHYDANMSQVFFADLRIPEPDYNLAIGSGTHGVQTGRMLAALDPVLHDENPDWVLVYGDTNSTLAASVSAVKLHLPVAHLEAGLRSFNRAMPEEHNRVMTDHCADLLLAPTQTAMDHLAREGLASRSRLVGDVMADICLRVATDNEALDAPLPFGLQSDQFLLASLHRAENTDDPSHLSQLVGALAALPLPVVLTVHPRLSSRASQSGIALDQGSLLPVEPQPYPQLMQLVANARGVLTDSGGLQKEAHILGTPCTTLRTETEWVETLEGGWNVLCPDVRVLPELALRRVSGHPPKLFGDGHAAASVAAALAADSVAG